MGERPQILSLSTVFPRPDEPGLGLFVARRLEHLGRLAPVEVVVPVPWVETSGPRPRMPQLSSGPSAERGPLTVHYRRWLYPPGLGRFHPSWMAMQLQTFLRRLRRRFRFDLIDAHFGFPEGAAALRLAKRLGVPFTVTLRGNEQIYARLPGRGRQMAEALARASAVIAVSGQLRDLAVSLGADPACCAVIGNGVDKEIFYPRPYDQVRIKLGMRADRIHLLSVGYLIPRKGHHRLVAFLPELWRAGFPADLWIIGEPGREGDIRQEIERIVRTHMLHPHVHMPGSVTAERLAEYMSACDVFCLASSREGWPNVVQEAMACGAPVVVTDVGAVPDLVPSSEFGIVVPRDDDEALLRALIQALGSRFDRERIARHGTSRSWQQVALEVFDVLQRAAAEPGLRALAGR